MTRVRPDRRGRTRGVRGGDLDGPRVDDLELVWVIEPRYAGLELTVAGIITMRSRL